MEYYIVAIINEEPQYFVGFDETFIPTFNINKTYAKLFYSYNSAKTQLNSIKEIALNRNIHIEDIYIIEDNNDVRVI